MSRVGHRGSPRTGLPGRRLVVLLAALSTIGPFSIDTMFPAFAEMNRALDVGPVAIQQTVSVYMAAFAVMTLVHGPLSDALGRRPVIVLGMTVYAVGSAMCALATSLPWLLAGRVVQGVCAGAGMIVARTVVRDVYAGEHAQRALSLLTLLFSLGPAVAPVMGGWLLGWGGWRAVFWFLAGLGLALCAATLQWLPETHPAPRRIPFRPRHLVRAVSAVLRTAGVVRLGLASACQFGALFCYISSAPAIVVTHLGMGPQDFWVLFLPLVAMLMLGSSISSRYAGRVPGRRLVAAGFALSALAALIQTVAILVLGPARLPWAVVGPAVTALGLTLVLPVLTLRLLDLAPAFRGTVSSVQGLLQNGLSAVVAGVLAPLVSGSLLTLGLAAGCLTVVGWALWASRDGNTPGPDPAD